MKYFQFPFKHQITQTQLTDTAVNVINPLRITNMENTKKTLFQNIYLEFFTNSSYKLQQ